MSQDNSTLEARRFGFSDEAWTRLSDRDKELYRYIRPRPRAKSTGHQPLHRIENWLKTMEEDCQSVGGSFQLNPDFQRGHVWDEDRQRAYVESYLRNCAPANFKFNCASYTSIERENNLGDLNPADVVCLDGLQRLTALRRFVAEDLSVFDGMKPNDFKGTDFDITRLNYMFEVEMYNFASRYDLLDFYISLNNGGVIHSDQEIERVKALREEARLPTAAQKRTARRAP